MLCTDFSPFPVLETRRLRLRKPEPGDIDENFRYRSDAAFMKYIPHRFATCRQDVEQTFDLMLERIERNESINWSITRKEDGRFLGLIGFVRIMVDQHRAEVGYLLHTPWQGQGFLHEALREVVNYAFGVIGLHSIEAVVNCQNIPSQRVLEKMGFSRDAFFRDYLHHQGAYVDAYVYSLLVDAIKLPSSVSTL